MKAVQFNDYGGPDVLQVADADEPHAGPGQIRIAVRAAGVNPVDWKIRAGYMAQQMPLRFPSGVGMDGAGVVDEVGDDAADVAVGDRVFGMGFGTYAEFAVLTSWARVPDGLELTEAAGYPIPSETAIRCIGQLGVGSGQTLLVSGASGGVGTAVLQIAKDRGITVVGTASEANQDYLRSLGALATVYGDGLSDRVRALAPGGVDAALHLSGAGVLPELVELTGDAQKVLSIADIPGAMQLGAQTSTRSPDPAAGLREAAELIQAGKLRIPLQRAFSLGDVQLAHETSQAGHAAGRIVVAIS